MAAAEQYHLMMVNMLRKERIYSDQRKYIGLRTCQGAPPAPPPPPPPPPKQCIKKLESGPVVVETRFKLELDAFRYQVKQDEERRAQIAKNARKSK